MPAHGHRRMTAVPETEGVHGLGQPRPLERIPIVALRVVQFTLDLAITALLTVLPMTAFLLLPSNPDGSLGALLVAIPLALALLILALAISWWYWAWLPGRRAGRTLAMGWLGLGVESAAGGPAVGSQFTLRWLALGLDAAFFGLVGLTAMLLSPHQQRLGDSLARTVVVRTTRQSTAPQ